MNPDQPPTSAPEETPPPVSTLAPNSASTPQPQIPNVPSGSFSPLETPQVSSEPQISPVPPTISPQQPSSPFQQQSDMNSSSVPVQPSKRLSKKLIVIIASVAAAIIICIVVFVLIPSMSGGKSLISSVVGGLNNAASLTSYSGDGYSISIPKNFKEVADTSKATPGVTSKSFNKSGVKSDTPVSSISAFTGPYTGTSRGEMVNTFDASVKTPIADTDVSKDASFKKTSTNGLDTYIGVGTQIKDGTATAKSYSAYIMGKNKLYLFVINVVTADESSIDGNAIIDSIKISE